MRADPISGPPSPSPPAKAHGRRGAKRLGVVSSPERAGSEAHTTGKNKQPTMLGGTFRGRWVVRAVFE
jgi:hypothetical protein